MTTRILIIDEDAEALLSYQEALQSKSKWLVDCAQSVNEGLRAAEENKPDIVIASLSIDDGQGPELLKRFETIAPHAQRFITAVEADKPKLESSFGSTFQFLPSPCPANRLITEIQRCIAIETWLGDDRIKRLVAKMGEFPSLPPIYLKVVSALNSRDSSASTIAQAIAGDLAITAKILQAVNSSYYGFDERISNITQAVGVLGIDCVKNLVLAIQVFNKLSRSEDQRAIIDQLWHHSMSVAVAARRIALHETNNEKIAEEAYTAGLLHDLGKMVLLSAEPDLSDAARQHARENQIPLWQAEDQIIGSNHAEIGAYLLARWGMPASLTEAVALHHQPVNSFGKSFSALAAVHVANAIVHERLSEDHPSAQPSNEFLVEIGKSGSWATWLAVTSGKALPEAEPKSGLTLKRPTDNAAIESAPSSAPTEHETESDQVVANEEPSPSSSQPVSGNRKTPLFALAACLGLAALGIGFYSLKSPSETNSAKISKTPPTHEKSTLLADLEKARESTGLNHSEKALQEIFDAVDAEPPQPEIAKSTPSSQTKERAKEAEKPAAALPKPKLPDTKDTFPNIELAGIFYNSQKPLASVNGKIHREGDTISGAKIIRIEKTHIVVQYEKIVRAIKLN